MHHVGGPVEAIDRVFSSGAGLAYLGEDVTMVEHQLQAAAQAANAGSAEPLVIAALVHDIGHMIEQGVELDATSAIANEVDARHDVTGAQWLATWFDARVTEPVRLHVAAKRYLVAVESTYAAQLSPASVHTLQLQGGPMSVSEIEAFRRNPAWVEAIAVRRFDEAAKDPAVVAPPLAHYADMIRRVARSA
ncbi:MAG: HD domain-containing protein [Ilumatobacteraceae bacterium]